jgi:hypothetical protein
VDDATKKRPAQEGPEAQGSERRRVSTIVHDERGNASVRWHDAPTDERRPVLEILGDPKLSVKNEETHDPYAHHPGRGEGGQSRGTGRTRTDLRKLSEWIKMMRELEERKKNGGGDGGDDR